MGGRSECDLPLSGRRRVSIVRSRGLHGPVTVRRAGATGARADVAWIRGGVRAGFARARHRSVGVERGEPDGADTGEDRARDSARRSTGRGPQGRGCGI